MFPRGRPGVALLLLRTVLGVTLLRGALTQSANADPSWVILAIGVVAIALCMGFLTPVASAMFVIIEVAARPFTIGAVEPLQVCAILVAVALALLGPGGYSVDARLFGRRQVIFPSRRNTKDK